MRVEKIHRQLGNRAIDHCFDIIVRMLLDLEYPHRQCHRGLSHRLAGFRRNLANARQQRASGFHGLGELALVAVMNVVGEPAAAHVEHLDRSAAELLDRAAPFEDALEQVPPLRDADIGARHVEVDAKGGVGRKPLHRLDELAEGLRAVERYAETRDDVRRADSDADMLRLHLARSQSRYAAVEVGDAVAEYRVHHLLRHHSFGPPLAGAVEDDLVRLEADLQRLLRFGKADALGHEAIVERELDQPGVGVGLDRIAAHHLHFVGAEPVGALGRALEQGRRGRVHEQELRRLDGGEVVALEIVDEAVRDGRDLLLWSILPHDLDQLRVRLVEPLGKRRQARRVLHRVADRARERLGERRQRVILADRHFEDDAGEFLAVGDRRLGSDAGGALHQQRRKVVTGNRCAVHPGREARVHLEQPQLSARIANHLELAPAGPVELLHHPPKRHEEVFRHGGDVAGPGLALGRDVALAHADGAEQLALIGAQHHRFLVAAHMRLKEQPLRRPYFCERVSGGFEHVPARRPRRIVVRPLQPHAPIMLAAEGVQIPVGAVGGDIGRDFDREIRRGFHCRLGDPLQPRERGREQILVPFREQAREPHRLEVTARDPEPAGIEDILHALAIGIEVELVPRPLQPKIVDIFPMKPGHPIRIFDSDHSRCGERLPKRPCNSDTRLGIAATIEAAHEYLHMSPGSSKSGLCKAQAGCNLRHVSAGLGKLLLLSFFIYSN
ncbi:MAG: hypothetical protein AVDCRST_MAG91-1172 [uncultured Sphingomonadaceae bacterium]|uniref:Uncharacterized protein n=1 Tax=uncultured Sphingomonadaceae bacterium TaxID=169976 RepID=A0A6J4SRD9_9SPHN|nr:MAG: hypothetical protein AVDCRST_MAG91-1172 [uncultured Sphingomonadaceae bacterium]